MLEQISVAIGKQLVASDEPIASDNFDEEA